MVIIVIIFRQNIFDFENLYNFLNVLYMKKTINKKRKNRKTATKKKRIITSTKKNRKMNKKGGKLLGEGSFGYVFGLPALPCDQDDINKNLNEYVSKIAKNSTENFRDEWNGAELLRNLPNVNDYFILPTKKCPVNSLYIKPPYTEDTWHSPVGIVDIVGKSMLLSDKANGTIEDFFKNNPNNILSNITKLLNIAKGIQLLQNNNLIHNDIKVSNCVIYENTAKIIDLADIRDMNTNDMINMPYNFFYFTWPSIMVYTYLYRQPNIIDINLLRTLYNDGIGTDSDSSKFNYKNITLLEEFIGLPFGYNFLNNKDFNKQIKEYKETLITQKTFGIINDFNAPTDKKNFYYTPYEWDTNPIEIIEDFFKNNINNNKDYSEDDKAKINKNVEM